MSKKITNAERNVEKKAANQALKDRLENFMVTATSVVLVLGVIFAVFNNYIKSSELNGGMIILVNILMWLGVAAVLVFAILGAVKKNQKLFKWCGAGAADAVLCFLFWRFSSYKTGFISGIAYCYYAIALYFIACLVYYFLALSKKWEKKPVRIAYYVIIAVVAIVFIASAVVFMYLNGNITGFAK